MRMTDEVLEHLKQLVAMNLSMDDEDLDHNDNSLLRAMVSGLYVALDELQTYRALYPETKIEHGNWTAPQGGGH